MIESLQTKVQEAHAKLEALLQEQSSTKTLTAKEINDATGELKAAKETLAAYEEAMKAKGPNKESKDTAGVEATKSKDSNFFSLSKQTTTLEPGELSQALKCLNDEQLNAIYSNEYKSAWLKWIDQGFSSLGATELKSIQLGNDGEGGFLAPAQFQPDVIQRKPMNTPFLDRMKNVVSEGRQLVYPKVAYSGAPDDPVPNEYINTYRPIVAGNQFGPNSIVVNQTYWTTVTVDVYSLGFLEQMDRNILADSKIPLETWIQDVFGRMERVWKEKKALTGSGTNEPLGILTALGGVAGAPVPQSFSLPALPASPSTAQVNAYAAALMALPDILDDQYHTDDCFWLMNRKNTKSTLNTFQSTTGQFLFSQGYQDALMGSRRAVELNGYPTAYSNAMPSAFVDNGNVAGGSVSGNTPFLFINPDACIGVERLALSVRRLDELYAASNQIGLLGTFRWGFGLLQPEYMSVVGVNQ